MITRIDFWEFLLIGDTIYSFVLGVLTFIEIYGVKKEDHINDRTVFLYCIQNLVSCVILYLFSLLICLRQRSSRARERRNEEPAQPEYQNTKTTAVLLMSKLLSYLIWASLFLAVMFPTKGRPYGSYVLLGFSADLIVLLGNTYYVWIIRPERVARSRLSFLNSVFIHVRMQERLRDERARAPLVENQGSYASAAA